MSGMYDARGYWTRTSKRGLALLASWIAIACAGDAHPPSATSTDADRQAGDADGLEVAVSVPPAAWLVERIGGERVAVASLLPPGRSPHTWEPSPRELAALGRARLMVVVGHPALRFEERLLAAARRSGGEPRVVAMTEGVELLAGGEGEDHGHGENGQQGEIGHGDEPGPGSGTDPHVWLDPEVMQGTGGRVAAALAAIDPGHAAEYRDRLEDLLTEIDALDRDLRAVLAGLPERRFLAYHPAWGYFAARYGLVQEAVEGGGKEPGPRRMVERLEAARGRGTRVVFVQRSVAGRGARVLAEEIGAEVVVLDPLAYDWPDNLRRVAAAIAEALGGDAAPAAAGASIAESSR